MDGIDRRQRWALAAGGMLLATVVGLIAYNLGLSHAAGHDVTEAAWGGHRHGWHTLGGLGFLFPLFFVFLWIGFIRRAWWGGPWSRRGYYAGWRDDPSRFDEWHQRAHQHMKETPPADDPGRRG